MTAAPSILRMLVTVGLLHVATSSACWDMGSCWWNHYETIQHTMKGLLRSSWDLGGTYRSIVDWCGHLPSETCAREGCNNARLASDLADIDAVYQEVCPTRQAFIRHSRCFQIRGLSDHLRHCADEAVEATGAYYDQATANHIVQCGSDFIDAAPTSVVCTEEGKTAIKNFLRYIVPASTRFQPFED